MFHFYSQSGSCSPINREQEFGGDQTEICFVARIMTQMNVNVQVC